MSAVEQAHLVASSTRDRRLLTDAIIKSNEASLTKSSGFKSLSCQPTRVIRGQDAAAQWPALACALHSRANDPLRASYSGATECAQRQYCQFLLTQASRIAAARADTVYTHPAAQCTNLKS